MSKKLEILHASATLFTTGNHFAEASEEHICELYNLEPAPANTEGYDAIKRKGSKIKRVQIKGRSLNKSGGTSPLDGVKPDGFDIMIALIVDKYKPIGYLEITSDYVYSHATYRNDDSKPGYALTIGKKFLQEYLSEKPSKTI